MPLMTDEHVRAKLAHEKGVIVLDEITWSLVKRVIPSNSPNARNGCDV